MYQKNKIRSLSPKEALVALTLVERRADVVTAAQIIEILNSESTGRKVIHNLLKKGWLTRLIGGRYLFLPPEHGPENLGGENNPLALASAVAEPSYVGWWATASHYGFTTQRPAKLSVAVLKPLSPREIEGFEIRFITLSPHKFFGVRTTKIAGREARLSSPAKTIVDCLDKPALAGGPSELTRIIFGAKNEVPFEHIVDDALAMRSITLLKRLGFLADLTGWTYSASLRECLQREIPPWTRSVFGRRQRGPGDIGFVREWGLSVHARAEELLADVPKIIDRTR